MLPVSIALIVVGSALHTQRNDSGILTTRTFGVFSSPLCVVDERAKTFPEDKLVIWVLLGVAQVCVYLFTIAARFNNSQVGHFFVCLAGGFCIIGVVGEGCMSLVVSIDCGIFVHSFVYMPYKNHSLRDMDQLFALLFGIMSLLWEVGLVRGYRRPSFLAVLLTREQELS